MKACKACHALYDDSADVCPKCSEKLSKDWIGEVAITDPEQSEIAKKLNIKAPGRYALKVR